MDVTAVSPEEHDWPSQSLVGIGPIARELESRGVPTSDLFAGCGLDAARLSDPEARISRRQRLMVYRNAQRLSPIPEIGLLAGRRQRLSDFGIYGYAFASCATLGDAVLFSLRNMALACPLLQVRYRTEAGGAVLSSHGMAEVGDVLPFVAEYWRSSMTTLVGHATEAAAFSRLMTFPYAAPPHWRMYHEMFRCQIEFDAGSMEWHIDDEALSRVLPDANPVNAGMLEAACARLGTPTRASTGIERRIRGLLTDTGRITSAGEMATLLGLSERSMFRRLAAEATTYQAIADDVRRTWAMKLLRDREEPIEAIANRLGYTEASNFGKAFRRWTGLTPGEYRLRCGE